MTTSVQLVWSVSTIPATTPTIRRHAVPRALSALHRQMALPLATSAHAEPHARPATWSTLRELDAYSTHRPKQRKRSVDKLFQSYALRASLPARLLGQQVLAPSSILPTESRTS